MADVRCGRFKPIKVDPATGMVTWSASIAPPPTSQWRHAFDAAIASEHAMGNEFSITLYVSDAAISFESPEDDAEVAAGVVRRAVEKANDIKAQGQALNPNDGGATLARLKARHREGI